MASSANAPQLRFSRHALSSYEAPEKYLKFVGKSYNLPDPSVQVMRKPQQFRPKS
jgi:hypothetical protein